jgi:hypothetical protein
MTRPNVLFFVAGRAAHRSLPVKALTKAEGRSDPLHLSRSHLNPMSDESLHTDGSVPGDPLAIPPRQDDALLMQRMLAEPRHIPLQLQRTPQAKLCRTSTWFARARCKFKAWLKKLMLRDAP